jgi:thiamine biosynthesis lipoprotein ApbE
MREMTKDRALVGVVTALALLVLAVGCGLVSDQGRQEAKKKVEAKGQQARQEAKKKVDDLQKKVDELLKKVEAQEQQDQKK